MAKRKVDKAYEAYESKGKKNPKAKDAGCPESYMDQKVRSMHLKPSKGKKDMQGADKGKPNRESSEKYAPQNKKWSVSQKFSEKPAQEKFWDEPKSYKLDKSGDYSLGSHSPKPSAKKMHNEHDYYDEGKSKGMKQKESRMQKEGSEKKGNSY